MGQMVQTPIEIDAKHEAQKAAFARIASIGVRPNLVDTIDDELWLAEDAAEWEIAAGSHDDCNDQSSLRSIK